VGFDPDGDDKTKLPFFGQADTTFHVTILHDGVEVASSKPTQYNARPHWREDFGFMDVDLSGAGVGEKLRAKVLFKVDENRKNETTFDSMVFPWSYFIDWIGIS
jgi:hypothetical protein